MNGSQRLLAAVSVSIGIITGTLGDMMIEGRGGSDALFMTVITNSTVGFAEVHQISEAGRVLTVILVFLGAGLTLFVAGAVVALWWQAVCGPYWGEDDWKHAVQSLF